MTNESIFTYLLDEKEIFGDVYKKALTFEKQIINEMYDASLNTSRIIIEKLLKILIVNVEEDRRLSKKFYHKKSKFYPLSEILYECRKRKYISSYNKIKNYINKYGNAGSHDHDKEFNMNDMKHAHKIIYEFTVECSKKYNSRIRTNDYSFDLSYIKGNSFTEKEKEDIVADVKVNEVSTEEIIKKAEDTFISKKDFENIVKPLVNDVGEFSKLTEKLTNIDYITNDNLDDILSNFDKSIKIDIVNEVEKSNIKHAKRIKEELAEIKEKQSDFDELYLSKDEFFDIVMPLSTKVKDLKNFDELMNNEEFITNDNLDDILSNFDESIRHDIIQEINKIKDNQITIGQIKELIDENNNEVLSSIKDIASEVIKEQLLSIIAEIRSVPTVEGGVIIEDPDYEIVESEDSFEIKEIEKIIGIPDKCPKCDTVLKKGAVKCHNCGYDLFDLINRRCPECGARLSIDSEVCTKCGFSFKTNKCSKCGFENKINSKFCTNCGNKLSD